MSVIADLALGAVPIAGGALFGVLAGAVRGPDFRALIQKDMDLLERIPPGQVEMRAALSNSIDRRIWELIGNADRSRELREAAMSYRGNWRDVIVFICAVMFTIVWWNVPHTRSNWWVTFGFLVLLSALMGYVAFRGLVRAFRGFRRRSSGAESAG